MASVKRSGDSPSGLAFVTRLVNPLLYRTQASCSRISTHYIDALHRNRIMIVVSRDKTNPRDAHTDARRVLLFTVDAIITTNIVSFVTLLRTVHRATFLKPTYISYRVRGFVGEFSIFSKTRVAGSTVSKAHL